MIWIFIKLLREKTENEQNKKRVSELENMLESAEINQLNVGFLTLLSLT